VRSWLVSLTLGACGFSASTELVMDDAGRTVRTWTLDSAAELGAPGYESSAMTIDPRGSITPHGYVYGALLARGVSGVKLWTNTSTDWNQISLADPKAIGLWQGNDITVRPLDLAFIGITDTSTVSVWFEGEMWIDAPGEVFRIRGNDTAFLYVATDGKTFDKLAPNNTATRVVVPASGWYPVRIGWSDGDNSGDINLEVDLGGNNFDNLAHTRFRVATSMLRGTYRTVFYREVHGGGIPDRLPSTTIQETPLHAATAFNPALVGSYTTSASAALDWSARWAGQLYAAAAGEYAVRATGKDGCSVRLGTAAPVSDRYLRDAKGTSTCTAAATLEAGWNDLIVDFTHVDMTPAFEVKVTTAPVADAALVGQPIPKERLRPIEPSSDRLIMASSFSALTIQDNQGANFATRNLTIAAAAGELVTSTDITVRVTTPAVSQLQFRLSHNSAQQQKAMIRVDDPNPAANSFIAQDVFDLGNGAAAAGVWSLGIADASNAQPGGDSRFEELHIAMHTRGGREQIAKSATWRSPVLENATAVSLVDSVKWSERLGAGATVAVRLRSCAMADCSDGTWSQPLANGAAPMLAANRYLQLEVAMTTDGTHEAEVDKIEVQYRTDKL
jgi:hypothetical protein